MSVPVRRIVRTRFAPAVLRRAVAWAGAALLLVPAGAAAQGPGPFAGWDRPVVTELEFTITRATDRGRRLDVDRPIRLAAGERVTIAVAAVDQYGRRFPRDRFRLDADPDMDCSGRVDLEWAIGEWRVRAGTNRGTCRVLAWVPGNLNLEYEIEFEVGGLGATNYTRGQAEEIVRRLYRALLQREVDEASGGAAVIEVQRGHVENLVRAVIGSGEFQQIRRQRDAAAILTAFYRGLLGREPDTAGLRQYLNELARGRHVEVVLDIIQSEEFERTLPGG